MSLEQPRKTDMGWVLPLHWAERGWRPRNAMDAVMYSFVEQLEAFAAEMEDQ